MALLILSLSPDLNEVAEKPVKVEANDLELRYFEPECRLQLNTALDESPAVDWGYDSDSASDE